MGHVSYAPTKALAQTVCDEWNAQGDTIISSAMPVYGILATAIDKGTGADRKTITDHMRDYINGDLLSYQTKEPPELATRQETVWGNAISLFTDMFNISPTITYDIQAIEQPADHRKAIEDYINGLNQWQFTAFHILVSATGSPIIATLAMHQKLTARQILEIILTEDHFYQEKYTALGHEISQDEINKINILQQDIDSCLFIVRECDN